MNRSLGEGKRCRRLCPGVSPEEAVSGAEFGLHTLGDFAHVCAALELRLELAHQGPMAAMPSASMPASASSMSASISSAESWAGRNV